MKINGTIFSKPQQDQLKRGIGAELDKVVAKVDDVDKRMLNYMGDWASGNEYHENDVVTYNGNLYEVIKSHTSSSTIGPNNTEYYKAMTASKYTQYTLDLTASNGRNEAIELCRQSQQGKNIIAIVGTTHYQISYVSTSISRIVLCAITGFISGAEISSAIIKLLRIENNSSSVTQVTVGSSGTTVTTDTTDLNAVIFLVEE